jgi:hypothetical protein
MLKNARLDLLNKSSGYSLLEFALTFIMTVPVILLTLDLSKIMQAKSVAKAAVSDAVRCLAVTDDPRCSKTSPVTYVPEYQLRLTSSSTQVEPQVRYSGEVKYLQGPSYDLGPFKALILDQAFASIEGLQELQADIPIYETEADVFYQSLSDQRLPSIRSGSDTNPVFAGDFNRISIPGTQESSTFGTDGRTRSSSYSKRFRVPEQYLNGICLGSGSYSKKDSDTFCHDSNQKVRGILWVKGSGSSSPNSSSGVSCARAELKLEHADKGSNKFTEYKDLTGQTFWNQAGNFIPRGYKESESSLINQSVIKTEYSDGKSTEAFKGEILFDLNKDYRLKVTLHKVSSLPNVNCVDGKAEYRISNVDFFLPEIKEVRKTVSCNETALACSQVSYCTEKGGQITSSKLSDDIFKKILSSAPKISQNKVSKSTISCHKRYSAHQSAEDFNRAELSGACVCEQAQLKLQPLAAQVIGPIKCPENTGVSDGVLDKNNIINSEQAKKICPLPMSASELSALSVALTRMWWTTSEKLVADTMTEQANNCRETEASKVIDRAWRSNFSAYKLPLKEQTKINASHYTNLIQTGPESNQFLEHDPSDPENLIKNPDFACGHFKVKTMQISDLKRKQDFIPGYLDKPENSFSNCLGSENVNLWKQTLAAELRQNYEATENTFFSPKYTVAGSKLISCQADLDRALLSNSSFDCKPLRYLDTKNSISSLLADKYISGPLPEICHKACTACQPELLRIHSDNKPEIIYAQEKAKELALEQLSTFSPWIGKNCQEADCVSLNFSTDEKRASGKASVKVNLFSRSLANSLVSDQNKNDYVEISAQSERLMERFIAKQ